VLRLLVDASIAARAPDPLDWDLLLDLTRANGVLVRTAERLATLGVQIPERFAAAVASERERVRSTLALVRQLSRACEAHGIEYVFPKLFQDYPDMGDDVDLLLLERSARVDDRIVAGLRASLAARDIGGWIAGTTTYTIDGCPSPLDV